MTLQLCAMFDPFFLLLREHKVPGKPNQGKNKSGGIKLSGFPHSYNP
jgi:hypothetical protein